MSEQTDKQTLGFQTEARQLLKLMIHSLYSNKEIFLRELISNASDAIDKLRFLSLENPDLLDGEADFEIKVEFDPEQKTITITDNGIGMSRDEVIENLGTIAKSGTAQFLTNLTGDQKKDSQLIGQFGVGFYASFIVANKVVVETRGAEQAEAEGCRWTSSGEADFDIETVERDARGTEITLYLNEDAEEFLNGYRLQTIVKKYADHVSVPVLMQKDAEAGQGDTEDDAGGDHPEFEVINRATALWTRSRSEVAEEEYQEFYKHIAHDYQDPLTWSHNRVEGKLEYTSLIYIPSKAPFDLWNRESPRGLKLYVQRVFIMDEAEQFLPLYLRFVKGIVDSNDLSLNVSREILQKDPAIDSMRAALTKRVLDSLEKLAKSDAEKYAQFWVEFGQVLKEGVAEDFTNKDKIAGLLRFATSTSGSDSQDQSLAGYVERMQADQDKIYYVAADSHQMAKHSPHLEIFNKKGIEVLLLSDRIDEWLVGHLSEFDGKPLQDVARGALDLDGSKDEDPADGEETGDEGLTDLIERLKTTFGDQVETVRTSQRLTDSPACLVVSEDEMGMQMRRILAQAGQSLPDAKRIFEVNANHPLVTRLDAEEDETRFERLAKVLFDQALLAEGSQLDDPATFVKNLNEFLLEVAGD